MLGLRACAAGVRQEKKKKKSKAKRGKAKKEKKQKKNKKGKKTAKKTKKASPEDAEEKEKQEAKAENQKLVTKGKGVQPLTSFVAIQALSGPCKVISKVGKKIQEIAALNDAINKMPGAQFLPSSSLQLHSLDQGSRVEKHRVPSPQINDSF